MLAGGSILGIFDFDDFHGDDHSADSRKLVLDPSTGQAVGYYSGY